MTDLPHTLMPKRVVGGKGGKVTQSDVDEAARLTYEAAERKRKEREKLLRDEREYTVDEIFSGVADGDDK